MTSTHLLGPQRFLTTAGAVVRGLGVEGPVATITAGWEERESDDAELDSVMDGRSQNLRLFGRMIVEQRFMEPTFLPTEISDGYRAVSSADGTFVVRGVPVGARLTADLVVRDQLHDVMGPGTIRLYEPLSRHTTMRVGGPAQFWAEPETYEGFADLVCLQLPTPGPLAVGRSAVCACLTHQAAHAVEPPLGL